MSKWIAEFDLEDGDTMPEHMDLEYKGMKLDFHCKPMWTPTSERLPKSSGVYIVTKEFNDGFERKVLTDACYFDGSIWYGDNRINHKREYIKKEIIAWMPLPAEPFKAESKE